MTTPTLAPTTLPEPDPRDLLLRRLARAWGDYADYFDLAHKPDLALDCRRWATEIREMLAGAG